MNNEQKRPQEGAKHRLTPRRIPFYGDSYKKLKNFRHKKYGVVAFSLLSFLCLGAAISNLPSPFGAEKGNDPAFALLGAFLSVALAYILDTYSLCKEILDDAWRKTLWLYDYSDCPAWTDHAPWHFNDPSKVSSLIEELYRKPIRIPSFRREKHGYLQQFIESRSRADENFPRSVPKHKNTKHARIQQNGSIQWKTQSTNPGKWSQARWI